METGNIWAVTISSFSAMADFESECLPPHFGVCGRTLCLLVSVNTHHSAKEGLATYPSRW